MCRFYAFQWRHVIPNHGYRDTILCCVCCGFQWSLKSLCCILALLAEPNLTADVNARKSSILQWSPIENNQGLQYQLPCCRTEPASKQYAQAKAGPNSFSIEPLATCRVRHVTTCSRASSICVLNHIHGFDVVSALEVAKGYMHPVYLNLPPVPVVSDILVAYGSLYVRRKWKRILWLLVLSPGDLKIVDLVQVFVKHRS